MRFMRLQVRIFLEKLDLGASYRRLHMLAAMAVMTITLIKNITYILLRLTFGIANGPNNFCLVSEPIIDLTNDFLRNETWDLSTTYSPLRSRFSTSKVCYHKDTPYGKACLLFANVPFYQAIADGYLDDIITAILDEDDWIKRDQNAAPLAVHTIFRPVKEGE